MDSAPMTGLSEVQLKWPEATCVEVMRHQKKGRKEIWPQDATGQTPNSWDLIYFIMGVHPPNIS